VHGGGVLACEDPLAIQSEGDGILGGGVLRARVPEQRPDVFLRLKQAGDEQRLV
jgi:hypothetical protein